MNGFDDEFMEFLRTNHPTDYLKACDNEVKPETLSRIFSDYSSYFNVWSKVPQSVRDAFNGKLPVEIMELASQGKIDDLRRIEAHKPPEDENESVYVPPAPEKVMATELFAAAFLAGYSQEAAYALSEHRLFRESLREKALAGTLSEDEKKAWRASRESDVKTIEKDWSEVQPEKMLVHLYAKYNRGQIGEDELLPRVVALMQKIEQQNRREDLLTYIKSRPIQKKLAHFREEVLTSLSQTIMHEITIDKPQKGLQDKLPLRSQIRRLIDAAASDDKKDLPGKVSDLVKSLKDKGGKLDLRSYGDDSSHPMPNDLRQMFMVACCVHKVPYSTANNEKIDPTNEYVKSLPSNMRALIISRDSARGDDTASKEISAQTKISAVLRGKDNSRSVG